MIEIAQQQDSKAILNVIKQSIESCSLDHDNNQNVIDEWLSNKTEENIINCSVHDKFHRTLILSGFCLLKIAKISLNSSFFPKPIKR
ncbi:hypothetical protein Ahae2126ch_16670 [Acinetobacter haemolyticus]|nr:hypothetical protein Ahae2126ch_16670 [Acinetobacter haemolyticus]